MVRFRPTTHMISNGLALGAALFAALVPSVVRAAQIRLRGDSASAIISSGPSNFNGGEFFVGGGSFPIIGGLADYNIFENGIFSFPGGFSINGFPATSSFEYEGPTDEPLGEGNVLDGAVEWTTVEDYPAFPTLIGTLTVESVRTGVGALDDPQFVADFPVGSVDSIVVTLAPFSVPNALSNCPAYEAVFPLPPGSTCFGFVGGEIVTPVTPVPEPAPLSVLGVALGLYLLARWALRGRIESFAKDLARSGRPAFICPSPTVA